MPTLSPDDWKALSPYLDQALAMSEDESERAGIFKAAWNGFGRSVMKITYWLRS